MCLPLKPNYGKDIHQDESQNGALIYSSEYETGSWSDSASPWNGVHNAPIVCTACEASLGGVVMVPGTDVCPSGFKMEYEGYIMGNHYNQYSGEYLCVDKKPEKGKGTTNRNWGRY